MLTRITSRITVTVFVMLFTFCINYVNAQFTNYVEPFNDLRDRSALDFHLGATTFLGDLGGNQGSGSPYFKDLNVKTIRPLIGASYLYFPLQWLAINTSLNHTLVTGADSLIKNKSGHAAGRYKRNLSFRSAITELSAEAEWYPLQMLFPYDKPILSPFVGSGIGVFHFNPKAQLNGQWVALQQLHLEGQGFSEYPDRKNYKKTQIYIPISFGVKYRVNDNYFISLSTTFRKTFTDYIDDVSTSYIDPNLFDKYLSADQANLAKQLYYRGSTSVNAKPGPFRGYANLDSYTSMFVSFIYLFHNTPKFNRP
jgi:hypothetical protein